jgi:hypothetical protein
MLTPANWEARITVSDLLTVTGGDSASGDLGYRGKKFQGL